MTLEAFVEKSGLFTLNEVKKMYLSEFQELLSLYGLKAVFRLNWKPVRIVEEKQ
jgi:hypothetical protein